MCKYCETPPEVELKCSLILHGKHYNFNTFKQKWFKTDYSSEICSNVNINYCPMCGRKLGG